MEGLKVVLLIMVWWILTGGALSSWIIGVPAIVLSLMMSRILPPLPSFHLNIRGAFHFLIFFIQQSILSGFDVAKRVVHPDCPLDPCLIKYKIRISNGSARIVFTNTISLLPGTLSVDLLDEDVLVHVLDKKDPILDNLQVLEIKIAALFGENL